MTNLERERLAYVLPRLLIVSMIIAAVIGIIWLAWWVVVLLAEDAVRFPALWTYLWIPATIACIFLPENERDTNKFMSLWFPRDNK